MIVWGGKGEGGLLGVRSIVVIIHIIFNFGILDIYNLSVKLLRSENVIITVDVVKLPISDLSPACPQVKVILCHVTRRCSAPQPSFSENQPVLTFKC